MSLIKSKSFPVTLKNKNTKFFTFLKKSSRWNSWVKRKRNFRWRFFSDWRACIQVLISSLLSPPLHLEKWRLFSCQFKQELRFSCTCQIPLAFYHCQQRQRFFRFSKDGYLSHLRVINWIKLCYVTLRLMKTKWLLFQ